MKKLSREVNVAVAAYRKLALLEFEAQLKNEELGRLMDKLDDEGLKDYVEATDAIQASLEEAHAYADARGFLPSVTRQRVRAAANDAGRSR